MMVRFEKVRKRYWSRKGEVIGLDDVSLSIERGEFVVVRGPSGCGKTTLLLSAGGMLRPSSGTIQVDERDLYGLSASARAAFRARTIGFVFQMFHLVPYLSVAENIALGAAAAPGRTQRHRTEELLDELGLRDRVDHRPAELSAGERQRVALARALYHGPPLLLADEPTGNLDPENAARVFEHLRLYNQRGGTVMVVTHGHTADPLASRIVLMSAGRV